MNPTVSLRPYQQKLDNDIHTAWAAGHRNVIAVSGTGSGKSVLVSNIILKGYNLGMRQVVGAHRNELVTQMSCHIAEQGVPHRIIGAKTTISEAISSHREKFGRSFYDPNANTAVIGVDTLMARSADLADWAKQIHRWVMDECFPAGTKISTPKGYVNIEDLKIGNKVLAFDEKTNKIEVRKVSRLFKNKIHNNMVRLKTSGRHVIVSTENHPYWTNRGWVEASNLKEGDTLYECISQDVNPIRLESVEIFKSADSSESFGSFVYNIEVDELHTYIANDIIVHNCHHIVGNDKVERNKWGKAVSMFSNAYGLGVTATPQRADGQGLGADYDGVFNFMVEGPPMRWLIDNKYLSDYEIVCPVSDMARNIEEEKLGKDGDWSHQAGRRASKKSKIVGDVVQNYAAFAMGRRAIVFATDIETAKEMAEQFNAFGVRAAALDGTSDPVYRRHVLKQFRSGEISVLVNVDLFDEGFDCLDMETEVLTPNGWKKYHEMENETQCYAWDKDSGKAVITSIQNIGSRLLGEGERMLEIKSQHTDIRVTEGHKIFYKDVNYYKYANGLSDEVKSRFADEIFQDSRNKFAIPLCAEGQFEGISLTDDEIRIIGWYMTDGYLDRNGALEIYQSKENYISEIKNLLERLNWKHRIRIRKMSTAYKNTDLTCFYIPKSVISYLKPFMDKKKPPIILNNMTREQFKILWDTMMDGNGSRQNGKDTCCVTRYKEQADFILAMASVRGFATMYGTYKTKNNVTMYNMRIRDEKWIRLYQKDKRGAKFTLSLPKNPEKVWCITNELGTLITRRNGKVVVLGNCPACDVVIMARPTASLGKYLQMVGRALRYMEGKIALIIDHVSNVIRHGFPDKYRLYSLARKDKRTKQVKDPNDIELTRCLNCLKPYEKFRTACPYCHAEKPLPDPRSRSVEMVDGDLMLLDRETLKQMRAKTELESAGDVGSRIAYATGNPIAGKAGANRQVEKIAAQEELKESFALFAAIQRAKGYDDREIHKQIYLTLGMDLLSALDGSRGRKEFEEINNIVKGWCVL